MCERLRTGPRKLMFNCPYCQKRRQVYEFEQGPVIARALTHFDEQHRYFAYNDYWQHRRSEKWWACASCNSPLPVETEEQLRQYLEKIHG